MDSRQAPLEMQEQAQRPDSGQMQTPEATPATPRFAADRSKPMTPRKMGRPVSERAPKTKPFGGILRVEVEDAAAEQEQEQTQEEMQVQIQAQSHEVREQEKAGKEAAESPPNGFPQKKRRGSFNASKSRPFGGKLRIDVEAAELAAPPVIGSPLSYYTSKKLPSNVHEAHPMSVFTTAENHVEEGLLSTASPFLEYGMVVGLVCDDRGGLIATEGFASRDVRLERLNYGVVPPMTRLGLGGQEEQRFFEEGEFRLLSCPYRDCLFEVVPKMTYDATIAYRSLIETSALSPPRAGSQPTVDNLRFKSEAESRLNAMMYKKLKGTQVIYGQTIQLRHMKSGKYVSLDPSPISFRGSEYAPVFLDTGGPSSHFSVLPRFKLRSKGAPVQRTDQMILTGGTEAQPYNLFVSNRNAADGVSIGVVGSSIHSSQWRAVHYDCVDEDSNFDDNDCMGTRNDGLRAGTCIRLLHLESSSWLSFHPTVPSSSSYSGVVTLQYSDENEQEYGVKEALSPNSLWEVENVSVYEGGQLKWRETITLRHLLTGKYLAVVHQQSPRATTRSTPVGRLSARTCSQAIAQDQPQGFRFMRTAIAHEETQIQNGDVVLIQHKKSNSFIHSIDTHASTMADIRLSAKPLANDTSSTGSGTNSGCSFTVVTLPGARDEDAFKIVVVPQCEVTDTLLLVSYKRSLKQFLKQFEFGLLVDEYPVFRFDREDTVAVFKRIERVLAELVDFCVRAEGGSTIQLRSRQSLFRTHQYIELLIEMIKAPFQNYGGPFSIDAVCSYNEDYLKSSQDPGDDKDELEMSGSPVRLRTDSRNNSLGGQGLISPRWRLSSQDYSWRRKSTNGSVPSSRLETHAAAMQSLNRVIPAINVLLLHISWANRTNELHAVKIAMPVLMELLGNGFQTSLPLSYLLRENRNLVESITAYAGIIRNFFELIATRGKSIRYMQFLVALCTSRGKGVPKTQEAICDMLFNPTNGYRDDVIVPIRPCLSGFDICVNSSETNQDIEVMFTRSAKLKETDSNGGKWISLARFYNEYYVKGKHRALGQYCYGLFRLYVSLCLDRNYVSIDYIQTAFPRENILKSVMDPCLSRSLRAVMMDLLRVAYVDCEPQKVMACPNYTRIWTDISTSASRALPSLSTAGYSPEDLAFFVALKGFCYSYFDRLHGVIQIDEIPENELTLSIIRVSRKLVEFGMYDSEDGLTRLVVQLFDLLDERTDFGRDLSTDDDTDYFQQTRHKEHQSSSSVLSSILRSRLGHASLNTRRQTLSSATPQQKAYTGRTGWGIISQPPTQSQNSVLFDGAGAMSSIRLNANRDFSKQYAADGSQDGSPGEGGTTFADSTPHHHLNKSLPQTHDADAHEMNEINRVVMEIKDEICAILLIVDQIRVDFLISTFLASFQARHGGPPSNSPHRAQDVIHTALFEDAVVRETVSSAFVASSRNLDILPHGHNHPEKMSPLATYLFGSKSLECKLSLARLGQRAVTTIFMQMLMYEYPPLVSKALELLLQQYNQHDQFLKEMKNVQLLITEETITTYNKLKGDVDELRRLAETTEVWMDLTSRSDFERAASVCQLLKSLVNVIEQLRVEDGSNGDQKRVGPRRKLAIRQTEILMNGNAPNEDETNSDADLLATNAKCAQKVSQPAELGPRKPTQRFVVEKQPPNRKLKQNDDRYVLRSTIGRVSRFSNGHEVVFPFGVLNIGQVVTSTTNDVQTIAAEARRLLRNLRAAQFVLNMLIDGAHFFDGHVLRDAGSQNQTPPHSPGSPTTRSRTKLQKRQCDYIRAVFGQGMQFLRVFCLGDAENQALVAPHATMIAHYVNELPVAQELLVAIYADNLPLYKMVPTELINSFVRRLISNGPDPRFLLFLETLVLCKEHPVVENQLLVLFQLLKSVENAKVLQLLDDNSQSVTLLGGLFRCHNSLLKGAPNGYGSKRAQQGESSQTDTSIKTHSANLSQHSTNTSFVEGGDSQYSKSSVADTGKILEYHVRLLHLFAACATGKNTKVQEICQQILPLSSVLNLLCHANCTEGVQLALLRFLDQVFLTADDIETPGFDDLVKTMIVLVQICESRIIQYLRSIHVKDMNRMATLSLRKNKVKLGQILGLSAQNPTESPPLYLVIFSVVPTLHSFLQQFPSIFDSSGEAQHHLIRFHTCVSLLFTVCATTKWQLAEDMMNSFEEIVYVMDKSIRPNLFQYGAAVNISLEQAWTLSFKNKERLECSSMNCEQELSDILQWALDKRDNEFLQSDPAQHEKGSHVPGLNESNEYAHDTNKVSTTDRAWGSIKADDVNTTGTVSGGGIGAMDVNSRASAKMDTISTAKPTAWGDEKTANIHRHKSSLQRKQSPHIENEDVKNQGRLLHRLSPSRYYKALRSGIRGSSRSNLGETLVTPFFGGALTDRYRTSDGANGLNEGPYFLGRHQNQFNELDQFLSWLQSHPRVQGAMREELNQMVQGILSVDRSMKDEFSPHMHLRNICLSFDLVVAKLVAHVEVLQDSSYLKTNLMLLDVFSRMIYAIEDAEERHNMQVKMNHLGVTRLVVQLISSRDNDALFASSIEVGVALLDGMNAEVQESFYDCWSELGNELFFERVQEHIEKAAKLVHDVDRGSVNSSLPYQEDSNVDEYLDLTEDVVDSQKSRQRQSVFGLDLDVVSTVKSAAANKRGAKMLVGTSIAPIFRFLQLLCEGHFLNAQRMFIRQPHKVVSANLVETTTSFLLDTYLALTDLDMGLITQLFETITEYCQGPCVEAQETVANYKFISAVNALMTHSFEQRDVRIQTAVRQLRASIVITLLSLLEGRSDRVLHVQLIQELNFEALKMNLMEIYTHFLRKFGTYAGNSKCSQDFYLTMGFNIYVLLQQLADQHLQEAWWIPSSEGGGLHGATISNVSQTTHGKAVDGGKSQDYRDAFYFFQANCAKVEIVWDHRRSPASFTSDRTSTRTSITLGGQAENISGQKLFSEVSSTGTLIPFYFPIHPICFCLTGKSKKKLVWDVSRDADKLSDFYARSDKLVDEMTHQSRLRYHYHVSKIAKKSEEIKRVSFCLAVVINLVVLLFYRAGAVDSTPYAENQVTFIHSWDEVSDPPSPSIWIDDALSAAGTLLIFLYCLVLGCYLLNSAPLLIKKGWKRRQRLEQAKNSKRSAHDAQHRSTGNKERESLQDTENLLRSLREREEEYDYLFLPPSIHKRPSKAGADAVIPRVTALVSPFDGILTKSSARDSGDALKGGSVGFQIEMIFIAILGSYVNKLYFAFLLLDVVDRYKELNNVLRSVSRPAKALGVTTLLYLIVVYVFAVVGFFFFREDYTPSGLTDDQRAGRAPYACQRLFQCFLVSLDQGLLTGGGLGSYLVQLPLGATVHSYARLIFDVSFNILLVVLLLNLVFGVIIDTFASLRTDDQEKKLDMQSRCFICSIDAYTFDRATKRGFHDHISRNHNMWHYLYLFVHIRKKRITEYNGLELFLAMRMAKKDMSFFPTHRALSLTQRGDVDENHEADFNSLDDRYYAASSWSGSKSFSPRTSQGSGTTPARHISDQRRMRARNARNNSAASLHASPDPRAGGYFDGSTPAIGMQTIDRAAAEKLERIEATMAALASAQIEMKEVQKRVEAQHMETLAAFAEGQQAVGQHPNPLLSSETGQSGNAPSHRSSLRAPGSITPRIFTFESVVDDAAVEGSSSLLLDNRQSSHLSVTLPRSVAPRLFSGDDTSKSEENNDIPRVLQPMELSWPDLDVPAAPSPVNAARIQHPNSSLTFHYESDNMKSRSSSSSESIAECSPGIANSILTTATSSPLSPKRKPGVVTPRSFKFDFDSSDEERKEDGRNHRKR